MTTIFDKASPLIKIIIYGVFITGLGFGLIGVWLVYLGATGETEFYILGQNFKSVNVGIGAVFVGGVIVAITIRRAIKTIELGMTHALTEMKAQNKNNREVLSGKQFELLKLIAREGEHGIYVCHLEHETDIGLDRQNIVYRCRDLERDGYITIAQLTDYLYTATEKGFKAIA
jgi:DNA-binding MarR family transcriptional regulator